MTYAEKLKDPRWQKKRLEVMQRDGFACTLCGDDKHTLHVHHSCYIGKNPWDTPSDCLETLCEDCHLFAEELKKLNPYERYLLICLIKRDGKEFINTWKEHVRKVVSGEIKREDFEDFSI